MVASRRKQKKKYLKERPTAAVYTCNGSLSLSFELTSYDRLGWPDGPDTCFLRCNYQLKLTGFFESHILFSLFLFYLSCKTITIETAPRSLLSLSLFPTNCLALHTKPGWYSYFFPFCRALNLNSARSIELFPKGRTERKRREREKSAGNS